MSKKTKTRSYLQHEVAKGGIKMYPEFKGEYVKRGFTLEKLVKELSNRGYNTTVSHLSLLLRGKYPISFKMAVDLKDIIQSELPLEKLFEVKEAS